MAAGRVVKGVNFTACGCRRSGGAGLATTPRALMKWCFSISPPPIKAAKRLVELVERTASICLFRSLLVEEIARDGITALLRAGADKVSLNSSAVKDPELISAGARQLEPSASWWPSMPAAAMVVLGCVRQRRPREHRP